MNMKKTLASMMAMACALGIGAFQAVPSVFAADPANSYVSLEPSSLTVKAGDTFDVNVTVRDFGSTKIGGMQLKIDQRGAGILELVKISENGKDCVGNVKTGESAFAVTPQDGKYPENASSVVTYTYKVPEGVSSGMTYSFGINKDFTYASDADGNDITLNGLGVLTYVYVADEAQKDVLIQPVQSRIEVQSGSEFSVDIKITGSDVAAVSGFQFKIGMPEGVECLGLEKNTTKNGLELNFNPNFLEIAAANKKGEDQSFDNDEIVATVKFRAKDIKDGTYTFVVYDALVSDTNGEISYIIATNQNELIVNRINTSEGGKLGDADLNGAVDAKDASKVLGEYATLSTGQSGTFNAQQNANGDVNFDGKIDSKDASRILAYYGYLSTGGNHK